MAAISDFFHDCDIMVDTSDTFDTIFGTIVFFTAISAIKMHGLLCKLHWQGRG